MEVSELLNFISTQGVSVAVLAFLLIRLEKRLDRVDRLLTLVAAHFDIPLNELTNGGDSKVVQIR